jgi:hypothetical protein
MGDEEDDIPPENHSCLICGRATTFIYFLRQGGFRVAYFTGYCEWFDRGINARNAFRGLVHRSWKESQIVEHWRFERRENDYSTILQLAISPVQS